MKTTFAERLELALKALNISKTNLAITLGVSPASISGWLNGKSPTFENLVKMSNVLNVSLCWLVAENGPMHLHGPTYITAEEERLLLRFREMPENSVDMLISMLAHFTESGTEIALKNRARAAKTVQTAQLAMILFDNKNIIMDINESYLDILKLAHDKKEHMIGSSFLDLIATHQKMSLLLELKDAEQHQKPLSLKCEHLLLDGKNTTAVYLNGTYKKNGIEGFFLATAFPMSA